MAKRISFSVISATGKYYYIYKIPDNICVLCNSGEETDYPASELNAHGPTVQGWHSSSTETADHSQPQEIVLRLHQAARVYRIQMLTHQFLIRKSEKDHIYKRRLGNTRYIKILCVYAR